MKKVTIAFLALNLALNVCKAQWGGIPDFETFNRELETSKVRAENDNEMYNGTVYVFETKDAGAILNDDKVVIGDMAMRYNGFDDQVEFEKKGEYFVLPKEKIFSNLLIGDDELVLKVYISLSKKVTGYFVPVVKGEIGLFLKNKVILNEAEEPGAFKEAKLAEFIVKQPEAYIQINEDELQCVKNKKDFLEIAPNHQKELSAYIKKNKVKFRKPESVKQLVEYYNSL